MDPIKNGLKSYLSDEDFSAPEIAAKTYIPPARECDSQQDLMYLEAACSADIYSIGKCMIYILGGDLKTNEMPDSVPLQIKRFLETEEIAQLVLYLVSDKARGITGQAINICGGQTMV